MLAIIICNEEELFEPLTDKPTALLRIAGKTLLERTVERLVDNGITSMFILSEDTHSYISQWLCEYKSKNPVSAEIMLSADLSKCSAADDDAILITEVSCQTEFSLDKLMKEHIESQNDVTFVSADKTVSPCGIAVTKYAYVKQYSLSDMHNITLLNMFENDQTKKVGICITDRTLHTISSSADFIQYQAEILYRDKAAILTHTPSNFSGATIIPPVYIGKDVTIESGAIIEKGSVIDDNAVVSSHSRISGSYVGQNAVIGKHCILTDAVICRGAVLMDRVNAMSGSAIGENAVVGEDTVLCDNTVVFKNKKNVSKKLNKSVITVSESFLSFDEDGCCSLYKGKIIPADYVRLGQAVGTALHIGDTVVVGHSSNACAQMMSNALICGLVSTGIKIMTVGECTQPQLFFCSARLSADILVYVGTDSCCGVRITHRSGIPMLYSVEKSITDNYNSTLFRAVKPKHFVLPADCGGAKFIYEQFLDNLLPTSFRGFNISFVTNDTMVERLTENIFKPRNDINGERIVFHLSPDPQRLSCYNDRTGNVPWERLCTLGCRIMFEQNKAVSLPYCFPSSADVIAEQEGGRLYRYFSVPVDESDREARAVASSFDNLFVNDGLILAAMIADYLNDKTLTLFQALEKTEKTATVQRYVVFNGDTNALFNTIADCSGENSEGISVRTNDARAIVKPLKNGNGLMIFAESVSCECASSFCDELTEKIKKYESGCDALR